MQPLEKCCNALSNNMLTLTFVRSIDLVAHLNINGSFYNTTIIKQNNMTYQHKIVFCIRDEFVYGFGVDTYIPVTRPIPVFWNRGKPKPIPIPSQNGENPSNWVWFGWVTAGMGFVAMPSSIGEHIYVCPLCEYTYLYFLNLLLLKMLEHFSILCTKLDDTAKLACIN